MNSCKYYDCGWCYAPDDVETSASSQSACLDPDYCPYLKSQMTKEETLECEIKEYTLEIEQKAKEIGNLKDILDRKEQELKQMKETDISTVLIEGDTATIMGVRYQRIIEPKSRTLKDIISEWIVIYNIRSDSVKDRITADLLERIETKWLPDELSCDNGVYELGWNDAIETIKDKLK
jgi:hypothetical protein